MKKLLLTLTALCISALGYSQTFIDNNITYSVTSTLSNTVAVTGYNINAGTDVVIPETVTPNASGKSSSSKITENMMVTYTVTAIGYQAFYNLGITSVTIPSSVATIGNDAFRNNLISSATLSDGLLGIGNSAFFNNQLASVTIPDSVIDIQSQAFSVNFITSVTIGNSVTTIGNNAFYNNNLTTVTIPDSVTTIDARAFDDNLITSVIIGSSVTSIGFAAFRDNPLANVTSLSTTPPTITTTGDSNDTFGLNRGSVNLYVPTGTIGAYVTDSGALWTNFNSVTEGTLNISNFELENDVKIITNEGMIKVMTSNSIKLKNYTIYNISGAKVVEGEKSEIPTHSFASGIYILKLDFDKGTVVKKVAIN